MNLKTVNNILITVIAIEHLVILALEMFLWKTPIGLKVFKLTPEIAETSAALAANQGLYNGFLAAGLFWGLLQKNKTFSFSINLFFLSCVLVAGIFGWLTVSKTIFFVQVLPATIALVILFVSRSK